MTAESSFHFLALLGLTSRGWLHGCLIWLIERRLYIEHLHLNRTLLGTLSSAPMRFLIFSSISFLYLCSDSTCDTVFWICSDHCVDPLILFSQTFVLISFRSFSSRYIFTTLFPVLVFFIVFLPLIGYYIKSCSLTNCLGRRTKVMFRTLTCFRFFPFFYFYKVKLLLVFALQPQNPNICSLSAGSTEQMDKVEDWRRLLFPEADCGR